MVLSISTILKKLDRYGKSFNFNIEGEDHKTNVGGISTILGFGVILYFVNYFGRDIVEKKKPNTLKTLDKFETFPFYDNYGPGNITISARMENYFGEIISSPRFFEYEFLLVEKYNSGETPENQTKTSRYNVSNCNPSLFPKYSNSSLYKIEDFFCPDNFNFTFGGYWSTKKMIIPTFLLKKCNNESIIEKNITCASEEEFEQLNVNGIFLSFMIHQNFIDMRNFNQPINPTYYYQSQGVNLNQKTKVHFNAIKYATSILNTDSDMFFQSEGYNQIFLDFMGLESDFITYNEPIYNNSIAIIILSISNDYYFYERTYVKIPDIIANVGGFFGIIDSIFIFEFYVNNDFTLSFISKFLKLETDSEHDIKPFEITNNKEVSKKNDYNSVANKKRKDILYINHKNNENLDEVSERSSKQLNLNYIEELEITNKEENLSYLNKDLYKLIKFRNKKRQLIEIKECDYTEYLFFTTSKSDKSNSTLPSIKLTKYSLLKTSEVYIEKICDILTYVKYLEQLEVIKKLIFNENQCFMLENLGKKLIAKDRSADTSGSFVDSKIQKRQLELLEYLSKSFTTDRRNLIDVYLYTFLDEELKESIQSIKELKPELN